MSPAKVKRLFGICGALLLVQATVVAAAADTATTDDLSVAEETDAGTVEQLPAESVQDQERGEKMKDKFSGRRLSDHYVLDDAVDDDNGDADEDREPEPEPEPQRKHAKPLKNVFMGIYKNFKSTYLGNKTSVEYKQHLRDRNGAAAAAAQETKDVAENDAQESEATLEPAATTIAATSAATTPIMTTIAHEQHHKRESDKKRPPKRKQQQKPAAAASTTAAKQRKRNKSKTAGGANTLLAEEVEATNEYSYSIGPGVNMSLDMSNDVVHVQLDGDNLREIFRGHWLSDNTEQGRGKKYDMMSKVLPLFILPFLIQSAIVPFLVTKLKLLLMKSILVGKLAIFLLIISALRNGNKMQSYEVAPSYWASEPSRRSELAAAASSMGYGPGSYRVEGKPAWIN